MHLAGHLTADRIWRSSNQPRRALRLSVRVAAFHEQSRKPHAKDLSSPPTTAHPNTITTSTATPSATPRHPSTPPNPPFESLNPDTFAALSPNALAAVLLSLTSTRHGGGTTPPPPAAIAAAIPQTNGAAGTGGGTVVGQARLFDVAAAAVGRHVYDMDATTLVDVLTAFSRAAVAAEAAEGEVEGEKVVLLGGGQASKELAKKATLEDAAAAIIGEGCKVVEGMWDRHRDVLALCCDALSSKVDQLSPPDLTRLAGAVATLRLAAPHLMAALCSRASDPAILSSFPSTDLVSLLEALARLPHRHPLLFTAAAERLAATALPPPPGPASIAAAAVGGGGGLPVISSSSSGGGGGIRGLSTDTTAVERVKPGGVATGGPEDMKAGAAESSNSSGVGVDVGKRGKMDGGGMLTPAQAVGTVWSLAAVGLYHRPLFDGAVSLLTDRLGSLEGSDLARLAWAYATIRHADESHRALWDRDLYDGIAGVCLEYGVSSFSPRALVTLIWSYASIPHFDGPLLSALSAAAAPVLPSLPPHDLVALAWSVTRLGHSHTGLMAALGEAALGSVGALDGEQLTAIAMAFPVTKAYSEKFFKYLVSEAQIRPHFFGQVALLDIIRLISRVQHRDPEYYGPALQVLLYHVHEAFLDAPVGEDGDGATGGCMNRFRFG